MDSLRRSIKKSLCALCVLCGSTAFASLDSELRAAEEKARAGDWKAATETYQNLQVEHPDDPAVLFGLACTQYRQAEAMPPGPGAEQRAQLYAGAKQGFDRIVSSGDAKYRENALFNRANCAAQLGAAIPPEQFKPKSAALREAVKNYEEVLTYYPENEGAKNNLDHVQFQLRQLMQNPPKEDPNKKDDQKQDNNEKQPPQTIVMFSQHSTDIPNAHTEVSKDTDTVTLVRPGAPAPAPEAKP